MGFTLAIGAIAAVVVGIGVSIALSALDEHYGITDRVIVGLDDISVNIVDQIEGAKQNLYREAGQLADSIFDYVIDSARAILIATAKHAIGKFLSGKPRFHL